MKSKLLYKKNLILFSILSILFVAAEASAEPTTSSQEPLSAEDTFEEDEDDSEDDDDLEGFGEDDDFGGFGDDGGGFTEITVDVEPVSNVPTSERSFFYRGFIKEEIAYSYQKPKAKFGFTRKEAQFSKVKTSTYLELEYKLGGNWKLKIAGGAFYDDHYRQKGRDQFHEETLDTYEQEYELKDTYVEGPLIGKTLWIKSGRQVIAWGESEGQQIVDMANPRDTRELGEVDIEDARIPVNATKLTYLRQGWEFNAVVIHEFRPDKMGSIGSDYDPYVLMRQPMLEVRSSRLPDTEVSGAEWMYRAFKSFNGGDFSLIYANTFDDAPHLAFDEKRSHERLTVLRPEFKRINTLGAAANWAVGSWLFKVEAAQKKEKAFARNDMQEQLMAGIYPPEAWTPKDTLQAMLGFDYTVHPEFTIVTEVSLVHIQDYEESLANKETATAQSIRVSHDFLNQTLKTLFLWLNLSDNNGDVFRINIDYNYMDGLTLSTGVILYEATKSDQFLFPYQANDRLLGSVKYSF